MHTPVYRNKEERGRSKSEGVREQNTSGLASIWKQAKQYIQEEREWGKSKPPNTTTTTSVDSSV